MGREFEYTRSHGHSSWFSSRSWACWLKASGSNDVTKMGHQSPTSPHLFFREVGGRQARSLQHSDEGGAVCLCKVSEGGEKYKGMWEEGENEGGKTERERQRERRAWERVSGTLPAMQVWCEKRCLRLQRQASEDGSCSASKTLYHRHATYAHTHSAAVNRLVEREGCVTRHLSKSMCGIPQQWRSEIKTMQHLIVIARTYNSDDKSL